MVLQEISPNVQSLGPIERKRPGPKPKPLTERQPKRLRPISRIERSYPRERKIEVLIFLRTHQIPDTQRLPGRIRDIEQRTADIASTGSYRMPTFKEASIYWKVPRSTIADWWLHKDQIVMAQSNSRTITRTAWSPQWPLMEEDLYQRFYQRRAQGLTVYRSWFRQNSTQIFTTLYPECSRLFVFSYGWFTNFQKRWNLSRRRITKQATKLPIDYIDKVI